MIILDATDRSLEIFLDAAPATNQLPIISSYVDVTTTTYTPATNHLVSNGTTAVTVVAAPAASTQRQVKLLVIRNKDTATRIVTLQLNVASTLRDIAKFTLAIDDVLIYTDGEGFKVLNSSGSVKQTVGGGITGSGTSGRIPRFTDSTAIGDAQISQDGTTGLLTFLKGMTPTVVALTDGVNIATDASLGNIFTVTLAGNRTLDNPTNPSNGQKAIWRIKQDATGSRTLAFGAAFRFGTDITGITLTTTASKTDYIGAVYNGTDSKWDIIAFVKGY